MSSNVGLCACVRVKYEPDQLDDRESGRLRESWKCDSCGTRFVREHFLKQAIQRAETAEAERERLQAEVVSAKAGESLQSGHLWNAYQASDQTNIMTFSGWINWNIIEREKAEAELARERERHQDLSVEVRKQLWLTHGCGIACLYGDDGEMQCGRFIPMIDFRRDSEAQILEGIEVHNARRWAEIQAEPAPVATGEE